MKIYVQFYTFTHREEGRGGERQRERRERGASKPGPHRVWYKPDSHAKLTTLDLINKCGRVAAWNCSFAVLCGIATSERKLCDSPQHCCHLLSLALTPFPCISKSHSSEFSSLKQIIGCHELEAMFCQQLLQIQFTETATSHPVLVNPRLGGHSRHLSKPGVLVTGWLEKGMR